MSDIFVAWREAVNLGCVGLTGDEACAGYYRMQDCGGLDVCDQNGDLGLRSAKDQTFSPGFDRDQENWVAHCEVQRLGWPEPIIRSFSVRDAKRAGLWQKEGPWMDYPKRMLQMRARAFALRDALRTLLKGHLEYRLPKDGGHSRKSGDGRPNIAPKTRLSLFLLAKGHCQSCQSKIYPGQIWEVDHIIPLALGGSNEPQNLQILCKICHQYKTNQNDISQIAKAKRQEIKHLGAKRSDQACQWPCGKQSKWKKKITGEIVRR